MGYYTNYEIEVKSENHDVAVAAIKALAAKSGYSSDFNTATSMLMTDAKWYDWSADVTAVSKEHPGVVFYIDGSGEGSGDIWKAWAHAGNVFKSEAEMTFAEPPWLGTAQSSAKDFATNLTEQARAELEKTERAELARLMDKYGDVNA